MIPRSGEVGMDSGVRCDPALHRVGAGEVAEEDQELLVPLLWFAYSDDVANGDPECGEQGGGAVRDAIVGAFLGLPGRRSSAPSVQGCREAICVNREAVAVRAASRKRRQLGQALQRVLLPYGR